MIIEESEKPTEEPKVRRSRKLSQKKVIGLCIVAGVLVITALTIFLSVHFGVKKPVIRVVEINNKSITISPKSEEGRLVFCVAKTPNSSFCEWQNTREIDMSEEATYYAFIKDLETGAVSDYWKFDFTIIDYSQYKI